MISKEPHIKPIGYPSSAPVHFVKTSPLSFAHVLDVGSRTQEIRIVFLFFILITKHVYLSILKTSNINLMRLFDVMNALIGQQLQEFVLHNIFTCYRPRRRNNKEQSIQNPQKSGSECMNHQPCTMHVKKCTI